MTNAYCSICTTQEPNKELREWAAGEDGLCDFHRVAPNEKTDAGFLVCGDDRKVVFVTHRQYLVTIREFKATSTASQKISEGNGSGRTPVYVSRSTVDGAQERPSRGRFPGGVLDGLLARKPTHVDGAEMPLALPLVAKAPHVSGDSEIKDEEVPDTIFADFADEPKLPPPEDEEEASAGTPADHEGESVAGAVEAQQPASAAIDHVPQVPQVVAQLSSVTAGEEAWRAVIDRAKKAFSTAYYEPSIDPRRIRPMQGQPRTVFNQDRLKRLRESIIQVGQIQPIMVRLIQGDEVGLIDGERRWQACMDGEPIPMRAMVVDVDDEAAQYVISVVANFNREGHTPLESSEAIVRMHENLGVPMKDIAEMFGKSTLWVYQRYGLRRLVPEVRAMLDPELPDKDQLPLMAAISISGIAPEKQLEVAILVRSKKLNTSNIRDFAVARGDVVSYGRKRKPSDVVDALLGTVESLERIAEKLRVAVSATPKDQIKALSPVRVERFRIHMGGTRESIKRVEDILKGTPLAVRNA